ncbi:Nif3-like dinuclear metal center hexameric protein [Desulfonatronum thiodismutans]|uniref:Nif3-like dinuclear metal center hexameric protein n=1 Tax=Desulfonatronum thiodismutans TaxID=159290 RepID=UPI0004ABE40C|nr:Nif3-like dinuclear metal center hexameric protein [Desulfonatronum thiodismutans]
MHVHELIAMIEATAPLQWAASWDRSGVQVAAGRKRVGKLAVGLDPTPGLIDQALGWGADFILVHHPLALKPELPALPNGYRHVLGALLRHDAWLYAAHTSLDVQPRGPVRWLAGELGLKNISVLEETGSRLGRWFRILGPEGRIEQVAQKLEGRPGVEVYALGARILEVVAAPGSDFEVYGVISGVEDDALRVVSHELDLPKEPLGFGFVGDMPEPTLWGEFSEALKRLLGPPKALAGIVPEKVNRVACCPGSGASLLGRVAKVGAQVYVTGDLKYHDAQAARELGYLVVDVGHFALEERMMRVFSEELRRKLTHGAVEVAFFPGIDFLSSSS